ARFGSQDLLGNVLEIDDNSTDSIVIELSAGGAGVQGRVTDKEGPAAGAEIWFAPAFNRREDAASYKSTRTDDGGNFEIQSLPPGIYNAFAFAPSRTPLSRGAIMNSEFMAPYLDSGVSVDLRSGQTIHQDLKVIRRLP